MTCGAVMSRIFYGKVGTAYTPTLAWMTGLAVKSATDPLVSNPETSDEVAAVAIYRVLKEELPKITGMTVKEVLVMAISLRKGRYDAEEYVSPYKDSTRKEVQRWGFDEGIFDGAMNGWARYVSHLSSTNELTSH